MRASRDGEARLTATVIFGLLAALAAGCDRPPAHGPLVVDSSPGRLGGRLVTALRAEPRTFNPVFAVDNVSREVVQHTTADLLHINRRTQEVEPSLASSWSISEDGRRYRLELRRGLLFSDGEPFDADDVVFSFGVYLDAELATPSRDQLIVGGQPLEVHKLSSHTVEFVLAEPAAAGLRLFDSLWMLPRHLLEEPYRQGRLAEAWGLGTPPQEIAGLGPFRFQEHRSGQRVVLVRNPHYWKVDRNDQRLPYLDELVFLFVPSEDAQVIRFQAGETDLIDRIAPSNYLELERTAGRGGYQLHDLGPGLNYVFLLFNQNDLRGRDLPELERRQRHWFQRLEFRRAVSSAIDRRGLVRIAYRNRATPIWSSVSPGYHYWHNESLERPERSLERAREQLRGAGFSWDERGRLLDAEGVAVEFTIITGSSNSQRVLAATLMQEDLRQLGMEVAVVPLEHRAVIDRILGRRDYEACLLELGGGDADPNPQLNLLLSNGSLHLWRLDQAEPASAWEAEIDRLMRRQLSAMDRVERKQMFDRVQQIMADNLPLVFLVSPHVLTGGKKTLGGFAPAILPPHTLWNVDELYWRDRSG